MNKCQGILEEGIQNKVHMKKIQSKSRISHHGQEDNQSDHEPQLQVQNQSELGSQNIKTVCLGGQSMADILGNHIKTSIRDDQKSEPPDCDVHLIPDSQAEHKDCYTNQGEINTNNNIALSEVKSNSTMVVHCDIACKSPDTQNFDHDDYEGSSQLFISSVANYSNMYRQMKEDQDEWYGTTDHETPLSSMFDQNLHTTIQICLVTETKFKPPDISNCFTVLRQKSLDDSILCLYHKRSIGPQPHTRGNGIWQWCDGVPWADSHTVPLIRVVPGYWMTGVRQQDSRETQRFAWCDGVPWIPTNNPYGLCYKYLLSETKFQPPDVCMDYRLETADPQECRPDWWLTTCSPSVLMTNEQYLQITCKVSLVAETKHKPPGTILPTTSVLVV